MLFASQALYELSALAKEFGDSDSAIKWADTSATLTKGINEYLTTEVDGVKIYAELYDIDNNMKFIKGMSWVNWAPMAAQWYAMDEKSCKILMIFMQNMIVKIMMIIRC